MAEKINTPYVVKEVSKRMGCYQKDARELLDHFTDIIIENIAGGEKVSYKPLGQFFIQRAGRGPNPDKFVIKFTPSVEARRKLREKQYYSGRNGHE